MILIGQYDSPFVRRVGIALRMYNLPFEHRGWSAFGDAAKLHVYNPLMRVPTLVLTDGFALIDSHTILDYLDSLVPEDVAMFPQVEPDRRHVMRATTLATGLADKAVSLFYERRMHDVMSPAWSERCQTQMASCLDAIEAERAAKPGPFWMGDRISHADIALACTMRFLTDVHDTIFSLSRYPAIQRHAEYFEAMPIFQEISQPFLAPV
jgi:glutathione S-transferase